jgi:HlyD family secretion protein
MGWIVAGVVVVVLAVGGYLFMRNRAVAQVDTTDQVETAVAFIGDLAASATASGQVEASQSASLAVDSPGIVEQVHVRLGDTVQPGDVLVRLETDSLALAVTQAEQSLAIAQASLDGLVAEPFASDVASAEAALASAQASLDGLLAGPSEAEMAQYQANLRASQASLSSASAQLQAVQDSVSQSQLLAAQSALISAQIAQANAQDRNEELTNAATDEALVSANQTLAAAQATYDALLAGPGTGDLGAAQASLGAAAARLDSAQANFALNTQAATDVQVAQARQQIAQAQASLANLVDGPTEAERTQAELAVRQAELTLAAAQESLDKATVVAPFAGLVTAVNVSEGEYATGVVIELVNSSSLEVVLSVDEVDIGQLALGQPAEITLEPWPDEVVQTAVGAIAPSASQDSSGLITYEVHLGLAQGDLPVLLGMTANAKLFTAKRDGVLLVPSGAVKTDRQTGSSTVNLVQRTADGQLQTETVPVTIGLGDGTNTQIIDGLAEGDEVLLGTLQISQGGGGGPFGRGG